MKIPSAAPAGAIPKPKLQLPTEDTIPVKTLSLLRWLIYGEKKIGKSSLLAKFPKTIFALFEPGASGLRIRSIEFFNKEGGYKWEEFVEFVDLIVNGDHDYENVAVDTIDRCYLACLVYVCKKLNIKYPTDLGYGKGWDAVRQEFEKQIGRLSSSGYGLVFISHADEKEVKDRMGGTFDKLMPTLQKQAKNYITGIADLIVFYGYHGNNRLLTIQGSEDIVSGNRLEENFWILGGYERSIELQEEKRLLRMNNTLTPEKEREFEDEFERIRIHSVPAGFSSQDAFDNFEYAFNNLQPTNGKPARSQIATMTDRIVPFDQRSKK